MFSKKSIRRFINTYAGSDNWHEIDAESLNFGYGWIHYSLIRVWQPENILCIGSKYGYIPALCALACKHNQRGLVRFVDAGFDQDLSRDQRRHWGGAGFWKKNNAQRHFSKFKLSDYIQAHVMTTQGFFDSHQKEKWDYLYLDGDHSYQGVKQDFDMFWPQLKDGGLLLLHDLNIEQQGGFKYGVGKLWKQLVDSQLNTIEVPGEYGLGIIQK